MNSVVSSLKPYQRNLLASAVALVASVIILGFLFGVFWLLKAFTSNFASVLWPLATAGIVSMILRPVVIGLEVKLKFPRWLAITSIYVLILLTMVILLAVILPIITDQTVSFVQKLPIIWENLREAVAIRFPAVEGFFVDMFGEDRFEAWKLALTEKLESKMGVIPSAAQDAMAKIGQIISIGTGLAIVPVYLFFFLSSDRDVSMDLDHQLSFLKKEIRDDIVFLIREFVGSIEAFFRGQILIGVIIGILLSIGFTAIGVNFGIGLGLFIGALNIIPYLGTVIGLGTVLPIAYFQPDGGLTLMLLALGTFIVVQAIEGYFLTPKIMGEKTGLHPLTIIIAIFFWGVALDGLLGMVMAIPLTAFFVVAWRLAKLKYLRYFSGEEVEHIATVSSAESKKESDEATKLDENQKDEDA